MSATQTKTILVVPLMGDVINPTNKYGEREGGGGQSSITVWGENEGSVDGMMGKG